MVLVQVDITLLIFYKKPYDTQCITQIYFSDPAHAGFFVVKK